jgi:hypothetical protein
MVVTGSEALSAHLLEPVLFWDKQYLVTH